MQIDEFIKQYKVFCDLKYGTKTGTAISYANALKYLFEYLGCNEVNEATILTIKSIEPDIADKSCVFYGKLLKSFVLNGRKSYVEKGFVKAAILALYEFLVEKPLYSIKNENDLLIKAVHDNTIVVPFEIKKIKRILPISGQSKHSYEINRVNGTVKNALNKIYSGRKAEKYFISYLKDYLGLNQGFDFIDVANNKEYGYDIRVFQYGIEIKNIKSGGFYLTDNEIARLEHSETHLIFVDIDNGIWLLKNNSDWIKNIISNIKSIRKICCDNYNLLDLTDIRINIDETAEKEMVEISDFNKEKFINLLNCMN